MVRSVSCPKLRQSSLNDLLEASNASVEVMVGLSWSVRLT